MTDRAILLRLSGDFYTKARKTRLRFLRRLAHNLEDALTTHGFTYRLQKSWSRFVLEVEPSPGAPDPAEVLPRVFGIQSGSEIERRPWSTLDDVVAAGEELFRDAVAGLRFAVRAHRRGDRAAIPFDSLAVERVLGRALLAHGAGVQLKDPAVTAHVEVEPGVVHFFRERVAGRGGLPIGVEGRAVALVTGLPGAMAQYSFTRAEISKVPMRRARSTISALSKPSSGRKTTSPLAASIAARFASVCDDTCPSASPVTIASPFTSAATASAARYIRRLSTTCQ